MKTVGDARSAGFDLFILYWTNGAVVGAHKVGLDTVPEATVLGQWTRSVSAQREEEKVSGVAISKPGDTEGNGAEEIMIWGERPEPEPAE